MSRLIITGLTIALFCCCDRMPFSRSSRTQRILVGKLDTFSYAVGRRIDSDSVDYIGAVTTETKLGDTVILLDPKLGPSEVTYTIVMLSSVPNHGPAWDTLKPLP